MLRTQSCHHLRLNDMFVISPSHQIQIAGREKKHVPQTCGARRHLGLSGGDWGFSSSQSSIVGNTSSPPLSILFRQSSTSMENSADSRNSSNQWQPSAGHLLSGSSFLDMIQPTPLSAQQLLQRPKKITCLTGIPTKSERRRSKSRTRATCR